MEFSQTITFSKNFSFKLISTEFRLCYFFSFNSTLPLRKSRNRKRLKQYYTRSVTKYYDTLTLSVWLYALLCCVYIIQHLNITCCWLEFMNCCKYFIIYSLRRIDSWRNGNDNRGRRSSCRRLAAVTKRFVSDFGRFVLCGHHHDDITYIAIIILALLLIPTTLLRGARA